MSYKNVLAVVIISFLNCIACFAAPQVASTTPASGPVGTQVQINGSGFGTAQGASTVTFSGASASVVSWSDTQVTAVVPTAAVTGAVQITVAGVGSNTGIYFSVPPPHVSSISPAAGTIGTQITVNGTGFGPIKGSSCVSFGLYCSTVITWSDTQIVATVVNGSVTGPTTVTVNSVGSNKDVLFTMPNPIVASLAPSNGPVGTQVQINGVGFGATQGSSTVSFNNVQATIVSWSDTQIAATVPATAITGALWVDLPGIRSNTNLVFSVAPPIITGITPSTGVGGTSVTINGSGFRPTRNSSNVTFNGQTATITSWTDTQIVASVPSAAATGPVVVSVSAQTNVISNQDVVFTVPSPVITGLVPSAGPVDTQVQINGAGFGAVQGSSTVKFSSIAATIVGWSDTQILAKVPLTATTGSVAVTVSGVTSSSVVNFTIPPPVITGVSPTSGLPGTLVTITGSGFQANKGNGWISFSGSNATTSTWTDTQITATVPQGAATGAVNVRANNFVYSNQDILFTVPKPLITSVTPSTGPPGTQVQINGSGFGATPGSSTVTFAGINATLGSWSDTQISATVPATAGTGVATVTVGGIASNNNIYFTVPPPVVTSVSPASGIVGTQFTVTGSGFQPVRGSSSISVNGTTATVNSWSDTQIVATAANGSTTGPVKVTVNSASSNLDVIFTLPSPFVSGLVPPNGPAGSRVLINGKGFGASQGTSSVSFQGTNATDVIWSDTQLSAAVPAGATSGSVIITEGGVASNNNQQFTISAVSIGSIAPPAGPLGTQVTVSGVGFGSTQGTSTISFNNVAATNIATWTDTQIIATVPSGAGTGTVKVVKGASTSNTNISFTVTSVAVTSVTPTSGEIGSQFQINGSGFGATQGTSTLRFSYYYAPTVVSWSDTQIIAKVPAVAGPLPVLINVGSASSNMDVYFTVVPPTVTSVSPSSGPVSTQVQISGSAFGATQGTAMFNGNPASIISWSDTQIVAQVPTSAASGPVKVWVANSSYDSNTTVYFTVPPRHVDSISPTSGAVGTQVTINGSGFHPNRDSGSVTFSPNSGASIVSWSDTQIVATVPAGAVSGPFYVWVGGPSNQDVVFTMSNPTITGLSPSSGPVGTQIQINGSGFGATQNGGTVTINSVSAAIVSWSDTQVVATVPVSATTGPVKLTTGGVASNTTATFTIPQPQITSISPSNGIIGTQVTINGTGFQSAKGNGGVIFNNINVPSIISWTDTQIVAAVPAGATTGPVKVNANNGNPSNNDNVFTLPNPIVRGLSPSTGSLGTQVQINGVGFGATQGSNTIRFYPNVSPTILSWSDTQIVVTLPATVTTGPVQVTTSGVASNNNIYFTVPTPKITSVSPASGIVGTQVTINGSGFQPTRGATGLYEVDFNTYPATIVSWSDTQIVATVASGTTTGPIRIYVNGVLSNQDVSFAMPNPIVTGVVPSTGTLGTQIQINGSGFGATQGSSTAKFYNSSSANIAVTSWSDTQITGTVPSTALTGPIQVTVGGVAGNANVYFTLTPPQITSISPTLGGAGRSVTVTGTGFLATQDSGYNRGTLNFTNGGSAAIASWSDTQVVATVPSGSITGPVRVNVSLQDSNLVNYTVPTNVVSSVSPTSGPIGIQVTVAGSGFGATQGASTLKFNGQLSSSITSWNNTQIVASVPATATTGPVEVTLNNIPSNITVTYTVPPPYISSFSPNEGLSGTQVTINGTGFQATQRDSTVTFNGVAAGIVSWSNTQIVASVPSTAATGPLFVNVNAIPSNLGNTFEVPHPVIASAAPGEAPPDGFITITGSGFGSNDWISPDGNSVVYIATLKFNGFTLNKVSWSDTSITARLPSNVTLGSGSLVLTRYSVDSNGVPFTVEGAPTIASISPATSAVGSTATITGSGFGPSADSSTLQFYGAVATIGTWSDTQIVASVPPGTATGPVNVVVAGVKSANSQFTVNNSVQVTDSLGHVTNYVATMLGGAWHPSFMMGGGCSSCTIRGALNRELDSVGKVLSNTDELQHKTFFAYDAAGNVTSNTIYLDPSTPVTTSYTYNSFGEPLTVTDPLGNVTTNTYDANGNLLTVTSPKPDAPTAASVTQFVYDTHGQLTQITDPLNHITTLAYYPTGLIHTITDAQSNVTSYEYDLRGNRTAVVDALNNRTTFAYDLGDRLTGIAYPDSTSVSFAYDSRGRRTSVTDQNGKVTSYAYDDADRLISVTDAALNVTTYAYDTENNLTSITDPNNHTTSFSYDEFGRVTQTTFPSTLTETYVYNAVSNLTSRTDRKSQTILYVYDALDRLTHKTYPDATGVDYVYDLVGKMKQVTDPSGTYGFAYDNMGRLIGTTTQYSFLPGITYSNTYGFDAASNHTSFTAPDGSTNTYAYDTLNRLATLTDSGAGQFTMGYDALSRRTQLTRPNGITTSYGYDPVSHLQSILHKLGVNTLDGATYVYDLAGNRTSKTNQLNSTVSNYRYDNIYQLTSVTQGTISSETYSFDPVGNRLSSLSVPSYAYDSSNEITAAGSSSSYTHDNNGNILTKIDGTETTTYTWDFENRLTSVHPPNQTTVTFKYDPLGRRIQKGGSVYVYDGANLIEEADAAGNLAARYVFGPGIDEPLAANRGATWEFYQADGLGSITSLSTSTGIVSDSFVYDSFGNVSASTGLFSQPFRFTGREWDAETGLYYYRARFYDSQNGRFISEDPIRFAGSSDFYAYTQNRPINATDPSGLKILVCTRRGFQAFSGGIGNHGFFYDTRNGDNCGKGEGNHPHGKDTPATPTAVCVEVPGSNGHEDELMACCRGQANRSFAAKHLIFPPYYDCQSMLGDCLVSYGFQNPGFPGGRLGCQKDCNKPPLVLNKPIVKPRSTGGGGGW